MAVVSFEPHGPHACDMGPTFLVFLNVLFGKKKENPTAPGEERRLGSFAMVMDALAQA